MAVRPGALSSSEIEQLALCLAASSDCVANFMKGMKTLAARSDRPAGAGQKRRKRDRHRNPTTVHFGNKMQDGVFPRK